MQRPMNSLWFRLMALEYRLKADKDLQFRLLVEAGVHVGMTVLDFGCGPGRYTVPAARIVGAEGRVYAVDVHPLAIQMTKRAAARAGLTNINLTRSDRATGLPSESADVVLLHDALHDVDEKGSVLSELCRVLKPEGRLSYRDHSLQGERLLSLMRASGFQLSKETATQLLFVKSSPRRASPPRGSQR